MDPSPWRTLDYAHPTLAPNVGPFPETPFLRCWWEHLGEGELVVAGEDGSFLPLVRQGRELHGAGSPDVTDYRTPLGQDLGPIADDLTALIGEGHTLHLESLPEEAARPLATELERRGLTVRLSDGEPTFVLHPGTGGRPYRGPSSRQARELRRKVRRYTKRLGKPQVLVWRGDRDAFERFVDLHRSSDGPKGEFLDERRGAFFGCLWDTPGWRLDELVADGHTVAFVFGFESDSVHYLYNTAYDTAYDALSPGVVLFTELIVGGLEDGVEAFDFLNGSESYKTRMGAVARRLFELDVA